jgi:uncharacterized protein (TIGR02145 family)
VIWRLDFKPEFDYVRLTTVLYLSINYFAMKRLRIFLVLCCGFLFIVPQAKAVYPTWLQAIVDNSHALLGQFYWNDVEKNFAGMGAADGTLTSLPDTSARLLTTTELSAKTDAVEGGLYWNKDLKEYTIGEVGGTVTDFVPDLTDVRLTTLQIAAKKDGDRGKLYYDTEQKKYYVARAHGALAANVLSCPETPQVIDSDGNVYRTLWIGDQCWMSENLNVGTKINDPGSAAISAACTGNAGTAQTIVGVECYCITESYASCQTSGTEQNEKYCYANDEANCTKNGALYEWQEAMDLPANCAYTDCSAQINTPHQGICPDGWHVPTDDEWKTLEGELGMTVAEQNGTGWRGTDEGNKLKSIDRCTGNSNCSTSGFSAPLAGYRNIAGGFLSSSSRASVWSASQGSSTYAWRRHLGSGYSTVYRSTHYKGFGFSLRCIQD